MHGVITGRDVLQHARLIWREFGWRCFLRCVRASFMGPKTTFLQIVWEHRRE